MRLRSYIPCEIKVGLASDFIFIIQAITQYFQDTSGPVLKFKNRTSSHIKFDVLTLRNFGPSYSLSVWWHAGLSETSKAVFSLTPLLTRFTRSLSPQPVQNTSETTMVITFLFHSCRAGLNLLTLRLTVFANAESLQSRTSKRSV